jgi:hypothetical protein
VIIVASSSAQSLPSFISRRGRERFIVGIGGRQGTVKVYGYVDMMDFEPTLAQTVRKSHLTVEDAAYVSAMVATVPYQ